MRKLRLVLTLAALSLALCLPAAAQLVLGQYEDEAPLGTWNIFGAPSAPSTGLGGAGFARAWDGSVSLTNPALLLTLARSSVTLTGTYTAASLFRFGLVNTGVVESRGNLSSGAVGLVYGGFAYRWKKWAFAAASAILENYGRPNIVVGDSAGASGYQLTFAQAGYLRVFHAGVARRIVSNVAAGIGINYVLGRLTRDTVEDSSDLQEVITITDSRREDYRGFFLNGGISWEVSGRLTAALVFRSSYVKKARARSFFRYEAASAGTDIRIDAEATNEYSQPWILGVGVSYRLAKSWALVADLARFGWSRYSVTYFDEPQSRPFRDVVKAGAGVEFLAAGRLSGKPASFPLRLGFSIDPQPMAAPRSSYLSIGFGAGLRTRALDLGFSAFFGRERGSGNSLSAGKAALTITYAFDR